MNFSKVALKVRNKLVAHAPTILTLVGVAGVAVTSTLAGVATIRVKDVIENEERYRLNKRANGIKVDVTLTKAEIFKMSWRYYVPTVIAFVATSTAIIGSNRISAKRQLALAGAYSIASEALKEYKAKVVETIGANKEQKIRDEINQDKVLANPIQDDDIYQTGWGNTKCFDPLSGRYFRSDIEKIRQAINTVNENFLADGYGSFLSVNDVYYELNLANTETGDLMGWNLDSDGILKPTYTSVLDERGNPCLCINFPVSPRQLTHG